MNTTASLQAVVLVALLAFARGGRQEPSHPFVAPGPETRVRAPSRPLRDKGGFVPWRDRQLLDRVPNGVRHVTAAAASGAAGVSILSPVEIVRVNMMVNQDWSVGQAIASSIKTGLFRGNTADTLSAALRIGVTMPAFGMYKRALQRMAAGSDGAAGDTPPRWTTFVAGALAGSTAALIVFPLDVVRTKMAIECDITNIASCMADVTASGGPLALYRGLTTTLIGVVPFNAIKLATYDMLRKWAVARADAGDEASASLPLGQTARFGAVAGEHSPHPPARLDAPLQPAMSTPATAALTKPAAPRAPTRLPRRRRRRRRLGRHRRCDVLLPAPTVTYRYLPLPTVICRHRRCDVLLPARGRAPPSDARRAAGDERGRGHAPDRA